MALTPPTSLCIVHRCRSSLVVLSPVFRIHRVADGHMVVRATTYYTTYHHLCRATLPPAPSVRFVDNRPLSYSTCDAAGREQHLYRYRDVHRDGPRFTAYLPRLHNHHFHCRTHTAKTVAVAGLRCAHGGAPAARALLIAYTYNTLPRLLRFAAGAPCRPVRSINAATPLLRWRKRVCHLLYYYRLPSTTGTGDALFRLGSGPTTYSTYLPAMITPCRQ